MTIRNDTQQTGEICSTLFSLSETINDFKLLYLSFTVLLDKQR